MPINPQPPAQPKDNPYFPLPLEPLVFEGFEGIDTSTTRPGVDDKKMWWCDGFMPLENRKLRTMYGLSSPVFTAPAGLTIVCYGFANIGSTPVCIIFMSNGSIYYLNTDTLVSSQIAAAGTVTNPSQFNIGMSQWGSQYVIIVAKQTNGYFIWNGTTFYLPGQTGSFGTVPTAIGGTSVETYSGRVWVFNGATFFFTAPGSVVDFSSLSGGGNITSTDSTLRVGYTKALQANGFLYLVADSSLSYISGVQTSGTPPVTTFTNQNADPESGTPWPWSATTYGRNVVFANSFGAHISYGAAVTKVSEPLDGVYATVPNFGTFVPSSAKATVFGRKLWVLLFQIIDPVSGQQRNKLFCWDSKRWWCTEQDTPLTFIQSQEINSVLICWGTDGTHLYQCFNQASANFQKIVQSKLWDAPGSYLTTKLASRLFGMMQYNSVLSPSISFSIENEESSATAGVTLVPLSMTWLNNSGDPITWLNNSSTVITWFRLGANGIVVMPPTEIAQNGVLTGLTMTTSAADLVIISFAISVDIAGYRG